MPDPTDINDQAAPPAATLPAPVSSHRALPAPPAEPLFRAADYANDGKAHLLLACTGSVATIKLPLILRALAPFSHTLSVRLIVTPSARSFLAGQSPEQPTLSSLLTTHRALVAGLHADADEWAVPWTRGAPILHIELRRWADLLAIAPLSANALAKTVSGMCEDLLGCVLRAWDVEGRGWRGRRKRVVVAPAMNSAMWQHPVTARQVRVLEEEWGVGAGDGGEAKGWVEVLRPAEKELACGDVGVGAMREWSEVVEVIKARLSLEEVEEGAGREDLKKGA